ncbi:MAG: transposase [archaeon]
MQRIQLNDLDLLKKEIFQLTQRHYRHKTIYRFVNNLYKRDVDCLFRFVTDSEIDSTNNISERELRALVIIRKISFGSRSTSGAHTMAMLLSVIQTLRLNNCNLLGGLKKIACNTSGY